MPQNNKCTGLIKGKPYNFLMGHRAKLMGISSHMTGKTRENNPNWKGGKSIDNMGYLRLYKPDHPKADSVGYVREHVYLAEKALGKTLPKGSQVHHFDNHQLVICQDISYHKLLHRRQKAYEACGHANWRKCWICKKYDDPKNMVTYPKRSAYHRSCQNERLRIKRLAKKSV